MAVKRNAACWRSAHCSRGRDHVHDRGAAATNLVTEGSDQRCNGPGLSLLTPPVLRECRHSGRGMGNSWPMSKAVGSSQLIPPFWSGLNLLLLLDCWRNFVRQTLPHMRHL
jgi:hypothetical protein